MDFVHILSQCTFYKAFVENLLKVGGYDTIGQCFGSMSEAKVEPRDWIIYAFKWEKTPQGYDFWNEIDKMWKNYVDNNGKGPLPIEGETRNGNEKEVSDTFKVAPRKKEKLKLNFEL